jgi:hypothetical protein
MKKFEVGKRYLITEEYHPLDDEVYEVAVVEISPSGKRIKIQYPSTGIMTWKSIKDYRIIEELIHISSSVKSIETPKQFQKIIGNKRKYKCASK